MQHDEVGQHAACGQGDGHQLLTHVRVSVWSLLPADERTEAGHTCSATTADEVKGCRQRQPDGRPLNEGSCCSNGIPPATLAYDTYRRSEGATPAEQSGCPGQPRTKSGGSAAHVSLPCKPATEQHMLRQARRGEPVLRLPATASGCETETNRSSLGQHQPISILPVISMIASRVASRSKRTGRSITAT